VTCKKNHEEGVNRMATDTTNEAGSTWRKWVSENPMGAALIAGFAATNMATICGTWLHGIGLPDLNWPLTNGALLLPKQSVVSQFWAGGILHFFNGIIFAVMYALVVHSKLRFLPNSSGGNIAKGMVYGILLALFSGLFMVPYVYYPHSGAGFLSLGFGFKTVLAVVVWHLIYGFFLGSVYNPKNRD
jgi:hypothetical protein